MLEEALQEQEEKVDALLKAAGKYVGALKSWKKACQTGHIATLNKSASQAVELVSEIPAKASDTKESWTFDITNYLEGDYWLKELQAIAAGKFSLRTLEDGDTLISSPVTVRAAPSRNALTLGKTSWTNLRPAVVASELKKLRDKTKDANSQEFLESLYRAFQREKGAVDFMRFRDIHDLFSLAPGYKKDNSIAAFTQQIYALNQSDIRTTRGGIKFGIESPTSGAKPRDIVSVVTEDGRTILYYTIWFK